ncbi:MAG: ShlB/FhaC/HecB family hemolysin secretion/activation protein [Sulfuritalea sp.]|nr:ShlB/FhaC/HecB family hemolysin secretion/activation protein [Sulfuritalea sp.]
MSFTRSRSTAIPYCHSRRSNARFTPFSGRTSVSPTSRKAREALERAYHEAGYLTVLVDIPEQRINSGAVSLRVTEGRVERLKVAGNRYTSRGEIRADTPSLAPGEVPNFTEVQQELAKAQRADRKLTPLLRPGKAPGTVEVELKVDDNLPLHGAVEINNKQSPDTTRRRLEASLRYDNLWQKGHSVGLSFQNSPLNTDQVEVYTGTYSLPLGSGTLAGYMVQVEQLVPTSATDHARQGHHLGPALHPPAAGAGRLLPQPDGGLRLQGLR